jgi:hypothetical protein
MKWQKVAVGFIQIISSQWPPRCKESYETRTLGALDDDSSRLQIGIISFWDNVLVMTDTDVSIYVTINCNSRRSVKPTIRPPTRKTEETRRVFVSSPECRAKPEQLFKYF